MGMGIFEYAKKLAIKEMLLNQGYVVIHTDSDKKRKEFHELAEKIKQELIQKGYKIPNHA